MSNSTSRPKLKEWLEENRVYFETLAATLLGTMAVIVAIAQTKTANEQTRLTRLQTEIATRELESVDAQEKIHETAEWGRLHRTMLNIIKKFYPGDETTLRQISSEDWAKWYREITLLLESQINNEVLISDREALGYWRNAMSTADTQEALRQSIPDDRQSPAKGALSIMRDVMHVWERLVLDSTQVSATGGHPKPEQR